VVPPAGPTPGAAAVPGSMPAPAGRHLLQNETKPGRQPPWQDAPAGSFFSVQWVVPSHSIHVHQIAQHCYAHALCCIVLVPLPPLPHSKSTLSVRGKLCIARVGPLPDCPLSFRMCPSSAGHSCSAA
jgi:hypothetical protein